MKIIIVKNKSEQKNNSTANLLKLTEYLYEVKKCTVGKRTQKAWDELIYLKPNRTKVSKKARKLIEHKLYSELIGNGSPKITTTISS